MPAAWTLVTLAHLGSVERQPLLIAHVVMSVILVAFVTLSWRDMASGVLRAWRTVILAGIPVTLAGTASFLLDPGPTTTTALQTVAVVGWMTLPAWGLYVTGRETPPAGRPRVYTAGAVVSALGAVVYLAGSALGGVLAAWVAGLLLVGVGQTAGILLAVRQS